MRETIGNGGGCGQTELLETFKQQLRPGTTRYFSRYFDFIFYFKLILEREERKKRGVNLLFYLFMHLLVVSRTCPDQGSELQLW